MFLSFPPSSLSRLKKTLHPFVTHNRLWRQPNARLFIHVCFASHLTSTFVERKKTFVYFSVAVHCQPASAFALASNDAYRSTEVACIRSRPFSLTNFVGRLLCGHFISSSSSSASLCSINYFDFQMLYLYESISLVSSARFECKPGRIHFSHSF